jgi:dolichol-phosphate mannosyltransferase
MKFKKLISRIRSVNVVELAKFSVVGVSGVVVNAGLLYLLTRHFHLKLELASPIAIEVSILSNFAWNNLWTFKKRQTPVTFWNRLLRYHLVTGLAGIVNYVLLLLLVRSFGMNDMVANLIGIALGTVINFTLSSMWTWRVRAS